MSKIGTTDTSHLILPDETVSTGNTSPEASNTTPPYTKSALKYSGNKQIPLSNRTVAIVINEQKSSLHARRELNPVFPENMKALIDRHLINDTFNNTLFCSGRGKKENEIIEALVAGLVSGIDPENYHEALNNIIDHLNTLEKTEPELALKISFALRTAVLIAAQRTGCKKESWEVYTLPSKEKGENFWDWVEKPQSWIPEAQALKAKFFQNTFVDSLELAKKHDANQVIMLKGGFGAGKSSYISQTLSRDGKGIISPDAGKHILRKPIKELSHANTHIQGSDAAFTQFDALIKNKKSFAVYDSSLNRVKDIHNYLVKCEQAGKSLQVTELIRDDKARALAVLSRSVEGEDPRIPLDFVLQDMSLAREQRASCVNAILHPEPCEGKKTRQRHSYKLYACNDKATDRQHILTITSDGTVTWIENEGISQEEAVKRLEAAGIRWCSEKNRFSSINPDENWEKHMRQELDKPVSHLLHSLSDDEKLTRTRVFSQRTFPLTGADFNSPETFYQNLDKSFCSCVSQKEFIMAFENVDAKLFRDLKEKVAKGQSVSYLDLPASVALSLNSRLGKDPWKKDGNDP